MSSRQPASLDLQGVDVTIADREILRRINLSVPPGELVALLGATGAGKSTLLRAIAGLDPVTAGAIWIDVDEVTHLRTEWRGVAIMLQSYPLWPHMTVADNVAFGLRRQGLTRSQVRERVARELGYVGLADFGRHRPWQLTPGQQQRAVLARTLAADARLDLLDEPFSAQDAQLRERLVRGLKRRQQQTGTTTLFATQERSEALRVADRIAVLHDGELQQVGSAMELYDNPANRFVAEYLGSVNLIDGVLEYSGGQVLFRTANGIAIPLFDEALRRSRTGTAMFRPHDLRVVDPDEAPTGRQVRFAGRVEQIEFLGDSLRCAVELDGSTVWIDLPRGGQPLAPNVGDRVVLGLDPERVRILDQ